MFVQSVDSTCRERTKTRKRAEESINLHKIRGSKKSGHVIKKQLGLMSNLSVIYLLDQPRSSSRRHTGCGASERSENLISHRRSRLSVSRLHNSLEVTAIGFENVTRCVITRKATQIIFDLRRKSPRFVTNFYSTIFRPLEMSSDVTDLCFLSRLQPNVPADEVPRVRSRQ